MRSFYTRSPHGTYPPLFSADPRLLTLWSKAEVRANASFIDGDAVTIRGVADPGTTVQLFDWLSPVASTVPDDDGRWSLVLASLTEGDHMFTAEATDGLGNTTSRSDQCTVTVGTDTALQRVGKEQHLDPSVGSAHLPLKAWLARKARTLMSRKEVDAIVPQRTEAESADRRVEREVPAHEDFEAEGMRGEKMGAGAAGVEARGAQVQQINPMALESREMEMRSGPAQVERGTSLDFEGEKEIVVQVREATFTPTSHGGEIEATVAIGSQQVTAAWRLKGADDLRSLIDPLMVLVQSVTFVPTPSGGEIRVIVRVGDRLFASKLLLGDQDSLKPLVDRLLDAIGAKFVRDLQSTVDHDASEPG